MFSVDVTQQSPTEVIKVLVMAITRSLTWSLQLLSFFHLVCTLWINSFITNNDHL